MLQTGTRTVDGTDPIKVYCYYECGNKYINLTSSQN